MIKKNRFKQIVIDSGYMQKYIAKQTGLSQTTLSSIYNGQIPQLENALRLAKFFGKKVEDIWDLEEDSNGEN